MRLCACCLLFALPALAATPNASLDKATRLYGDLNYTDAGKALDAALKQPGNDRASLLKILELQGVVLATLGQPEKAAKVFEQLLTLDPEFKLAGNYPPRVTTAFYEARGWSEANGHLEARLLDAVVEPGRVKQVRIEVSKDPLKLAKKARFHLEQKGGGAEFVIPLVGGLAAASPTTATAELSWWVELLGEKDAVLIELGTATSPKVERAPSSPAEEKVHVAVEPDPEPESAPVVVAPRRSTPINGKRLASFGLVGAAVACAAIGAVFGVNANASRSQVDGVPKNTAGQISTLTQVQAYEIDARQRSQATIANAMFIAGAALAVGGGTLLFLSFSGSDSSAQLVPTGPGVAIVGTFP